ncbi:Nn.00g047200.m01.CDS01 [Neocucurbitaria sp. VM-36]
MARQRFQSPAQGGSQGGQAYAKDASSEDNAGRTESQQMFALRPLLKKPQGDDKEVQRFRAKVIADQKQLKALLGHRIHQARIHREEEETRRRNEIATKIMEALQKPNQPTQGESPTFMGTSIAGNAAYASVVDVLTASEGLIAQYQRLDNIIKDLWNEDAESVADKWKQDIHETEMQLKMGARVALRNVKKVLGADVESDEVVAAEEGVDENMEGVVGEELDYELQKSLRYAERGIKRMVKGLPKDEDD